MSNVKDHVTPEQCAENRVALKPKFGRLLNLMHQPDRTFVMNYHTGYIKCGRMETGPHAARDVSYQRPDGKTVTVPANWKLLSREEVHALWPMYVQFAQADHDATNKLAASMEMRGAAVQNYGTLPPGIQRKEDIFKFGLSGKQAQNVANHLAALERADELAEEAQQCRDRADLYKKPQVFEAFDHFRHEIYKSKPKGYLEWYAHLKREERDVLREQIKVEDVTREEMQRARARVRAQKELGIEVAYSEVAQLPVRPDAQKRGRGRPRKYQDALAPAEDLAIAEPVHEQAEKLMEASDGAIKQAKGAADTEAEGTEE